MLASGIRIKGLSKGAKQADSHASNLHKSSTGLPPAPPKPSSICDLLEWRDSLVVLTTAPSCFIFGMKWLDLLGTSNRSSIDVRMCGTCGKNVRI